MNIDFSACATFKGENQKPLWVAERFFGMRSRPSITEIARTAIKRGLDGVVLRSFSHPEGTDDRWEFYRVQMERSGDFSYLGNGVALYSSPDFGKKLIIIHGQGLMTSEGNIQVLFSDEPVGKRGKDYNKEFKYIIEKARNSGNVLITAARPYAWKKYFLNDVDALEVWNGMDSPVNNERAKQIAEELQIPGVYVSNSKCLRDLGTSYTTIDATDMNLSSSPKIIQLISNGLNSGLNGREGTSRLSKIIQLAAIAEVNITGNKN